MATHGRVLPLDCYVALHIRPGPPFPGDSNPPQIAANAPFQLSSDIWIERFEEQFAINIQGACEPANYKTENRVWDRHLYAFVRREPEEERLLRRRSGTAVRDEGIRPLFTIIALSRLGVTSEGTKVRMIPLCKLSFEILLCTNCARIKPFSMHWG